MATVKCPACGEVHIVLRNSHIKTSLITCTRINKRNVGEVLQAVKKAFRLDDGPVPMFVNAHLSNN
jgi:hypothetical protein